MSFQSSFNNKCMECFREESMTLHIVVAYKNHILGGYTMLRRFVEKESNGDDF